MQKQKTEEQTHNINYVQQQASSKEWNVTSHLAWKTNNFRLMYERGWIVVVDGWAWHFTECKQANKKPYL